MSLHRLQAYLHCKELDVATNHVESLPEHPDQVCVEEGEFSWEEDSSSRSTLRNLNVKVKNIELLACVGAVGSGKSSFLASVFGEMHKLHGQVLKIITIFCVYYTSRRLILVHYMPSFSLQIDLKFCTNQGRIDYDLKVIASTIC